MVNSLCIINTPDGCVFTIRPSRLVDSCTNIAWECTAHSGHIINRHIAACHLVHAAINKTAKGGGALHITSNCIIVAADMGTRPQTTKETVKSLMSTHPPPTDPLQTLGIAIFRGTG